MIKNKEAKKALKTLYKFCMERDCSECMLHETHTAINGTKYEICALTRSNPTMYDEIIKMIEEVKK
jgi:hypothetical protein